MGRIICKIPHDGKDYYLLYSTIVDSFITYGTDRTTFDEFMRQEEGARYMRTEHPDRMHRVDTYGTSSIPHETVEELLCCNRCGPGETKLDMDEVIERFIWRRGAEL